MLSEAVIDIHPATNPKLVLSHFAMLFNSIYRCLRNALRSLSCGPPVSLARCHAYLHLGLRFMFGSSGGSAAVVSSVAGWPLRPAGGQSVGCESRMPVAERGVSGVSLTS